MKKLGSKDRRRLKKERLASKNYVRIPKKDKPKKSHYSGKIYDEYMYPPDGPKECGKFGLRIVGIYIGILLGLGEIDLDKSFLEIVESFIKGWFPWGMSGILCYVLGNYVSPTFGCKRVYLDFDHREESYVRIFGRNHKFDNLKGVIIDKKKGIGAKLGAKHLVKFYRKEDNKYIGCLFSQCFDTQINDVISALIQYGGVLENEEIYTGEIRTNHNYTEPTEDWI
ncbi:hypothetical protein [Lachnobacterium bovis]|uniref:hypothetical protein n=1 Tax=Lachnobacterium bovis TaxID=140626 RepID=UPI00048E1FD0|nr:hypothetical protein [Lachnobacterium bovis]SFG82641.1 hypothetical protein SAMN04487761_1629 [Lachnospiraceae bacterium C7]